MLACAYAFTSLFNSELTCRDVMEQIQRDMHMSGARACARACARARAPSFCPLQSRSHLNALQDRRSAHILSWELGAGIARAPSFCPLQSRSHLNALQDRRKAFRWDLD
jgi:hypothetical protein